MFSAFSFLLSTSHISVVQESTETKEPGRASFARPHLIFFTALEGAALEQMLTHNQLLDELSEQHYGVALALSECSDIQANVVRQLNMRGIHTVAWLRLPPHDERGFNLQNYPQAVECYRALRDWARTNQLTISAVGLDIEPPLSEIVRFRRLDLRDIVRRLWAARENVLYPAARVAYTDLIAEIHHDGYEVHTYQLAVLADDRRAGTTLIQRVLDVIDLPVDVEVLKCPSSLAIDRLNNDLGGALIANYGPAADSIAIGSTGRYGAATDNIDKNLYPLSWEAIKRDLLLAARYTDIIYVSSLEGCVERDLLPRLAHMDWSYEPKLPDYRPGVVAAARGLLLLLLLIGRFRQTLLAWAGWMLAAFLAYRQVRRWWRDKSPRVIR